MTAPIIGLLDSGLADPAIAAAACRITLDGDGRAVIAPAGRDRLGHGTALAAEILGRAPAIRLLSAQVFDDRAATSARALAAGLSWLLAEGARVINISVGLTEDRAVLRQACQDAAAAGALLVASVPAIGPVVFPAAYPGVLRVTGDARCAEDEVALLDGVRAEFGASPRPRGDRPGVAGASLAAARLSGMLAAFLAAAPRRGADQAVAHLAAIAHHRGPQRPPTGGGRP